MLALQNQQARMDNNNRLAMWLSKHLDMRRAWQQIKSNRVGRCTGIRAG
jgi:hypothetical protein